MEISDIHTCGTTSSLLDLFSISSRQEENEDEEALIWVALEKLPTYNRLRKGILTDSKGEPSKIDIHDLRLIERRDLLDRLTNVADKGNESLLLKLRNLIDRYQNSDSL